MKRFPLSEYFNRTLVFPTAALSEDGTRLAYISSVTGSPQVWIANVPEAGLLSYPRLLTNDSSKRAYFFSAGLQWIGNELLICLFDTDGDESTFIEIHNLKTGDLIPIPRGEAGTRDFLGYVEGSKIFFSSNRGGLISQGAFVFDLKTLSVTQIYHKPGFSVVWFPGIKFKGFKLISVLKENAANQVYGLKEAKGGTSTKVIPIFERENAAMEVLKELPGGKLLVATDDQREFTSAAEYDVASGSLKFLAKDTWGSEYHSSPSGDFLIQVENHAGVSEVRLFKMPGWKAQKIKFPGPGVVDHVSFSKNSKFALIGYQSSREPREFYRLNLKTKTLQRLMDNYTSRVPQSSLVHPKSVKYCSQNRDIYSLFFTPKGAKRNASLPVIVWPHGGPHAQERPQQRPPFQYFLSRGYAIWAPNHTGSLGFGKAGVRAIEGQWGTADLPDMLNGIEWLKNSGWIDPDRMVIMGGSYGGYMTLRTITRHPNIFKAAVDIFGPANLLSFSNSVPLDWRPFMNQLIGDPVKDEAKLRSQSPFFELDRIQCPLIVIQGAKDSRVVKAESDSVVETLRNLGRQVEYLVFDDEGHGFFKLSNELKAFEAIAKFLEDLKI